MLRWPIFCTPLYYLFRFFQSKFSVVTWFLDGQLAFIIQNMPGGGGSEHDDLGGGHQYEELALGFANRSAVLFQLKEYELCIRDITR